MARYESWDHGETIELDEGQPLHLRCCDCGLVHEMIVEPVRRGSVKLTIRRLSRETGQSRRWGKFKEASHEHE
jgi:uncharacterized Zn finger protein